MTYRLKCPKCGKTDYLVLELKHARLSYNVSIDEYTGELDYRYEEIIEADEMFYCSMCNHVSKNINDFINNEE